MTAKSKILAENEVKKLATMLAPISFVFPPRKYPHKENMFFVESNWNKLG